MEIVNPQLQQFMEQASAEVTPEWMKLTRPMGGTLLMDVGPRGGGKTTKGVQEVQVYKEREPEVRRVANVPIENAYYVPNILKFLATKLIAEGGVKPYTFNPDGTVHITGRTNIPAKMYVVVDESAISGLEARGSGLYPLNTYLLALSRKINVDCELITQMMCLAKGTLIQTPSGQVAIERIRVGDLVVDNTYWGESVKRIAGVSKQIQPKLLSILLESGHIIRATPNHRFPVYVRQQTKRDAFASDLMVGDMLKIDSWKFPRTLDPLYQLMGVLHAEAGWRITQGMKEVNQLSIHIDKRETELRQFIINVIQHYRPDAHIGMRREDETNRCVLVLSRKGDVQFFKNVYYDFIMGRRSPQQMRSFLCGLFEGDGCVESASFTISLCQSESNRLKLMVALDCLKELGIPFRLYSGWRAVGGAAKEYAKEKGYVVHRVKISGAWAGVFANTIGFISSTKQKKLQSLAKNLYARITNIAEINKPSEVYDLTIEKGAPYFMANGIRSHNSMADKRAQWLSDFYCLCEFNRIKSWFHYQYYDSEYVKTKAYHIRYEFAKRYLFPKFDTTDIPNYDELAAAFRSQFNIDADAMAVYEDIKAGRPHKPAPNVTTEFRQMFYLDRKALRPQMGRYPGDTVLITEDEKGNPLTDSEGSPINKRYEVIQRDWLADAGKYRYRLQEIPEIASQQSAMDEAGAEAIEVETDN